MVIKFTLPVPFEHISPYFIKISELQPLPEYIIKRGPFIKNKVGDKIRIITIYDFDESRLAEAWEIISDQLDVFRDIPGFNFSAHRHIVFTEMKDEQSIRLENSRLVSITEKEM
jgi:hypothetical protein